MRLLPRTAPRCAAPCCMPVSSSWNVGCRHRDCSPLMNSMRASACLHCSARPRARTRPSTPAVKAAANWFTSATLPMLPTTRTSARNICAWRPASPSTSPCSSMASWKTRRWANSAARHARCARRMRSRPPRCRTEAPTAEVMHDHPTHACSTGRCACIHDQRTEYP